MPAGEIRIKGQAELERAFRDLRKEVLAEMRPALRAIGEEVRVDAQSRAAATGNVAVRSAGPDWSKMKLSVTLKGVRVLAASRRTIGPPRSNFATLVMERAMQPALDAKQEEAVAAFTALCDVSAARNGFF